jgi:CheY-like chemotaxis protein
VALTANASARDREASLDAGMDGYLAKPFDLKQLADLLADHLLPSRGTAAAAEELVMVEPLAESAAAAQQPTPSRR